MSAFAHLEDDHAAAARAALAAVRPDATVLAADPLGRGNRKQTLLVSLPDGRLVVQVCPERRWLRTEAAVLARLAETPVPAPAVEAAGTAAGVAYLVTEHVDGADLHERFTAVTPDDRRRLARRFGRHLAETHDAVAFDRYGEVDAEEGALVAEAPEWPRWARGYARNALDRLPAAFDDLRPDLEAVVDASLDPAPSSRLFPWDFRPGNALVADGELACILDWEAPLAAPPALSVAKAEYLVADWYVSDPGPLRTAFRRGYAAVRDPPAVDPFHRVVAVADSAVDSRGRVTNPRYPELDREGAVAFHRRALARWV